MALRNGLDVVAIATRGVYTETYVTATGGGNIANLFVSWGLFEDAAAPPEPTGFWFIHWFFEMF